MKQKFINQLIFAMLTATIILLPLSMVFFLFIMFGQPLSASSSAAKVETVDLTSFEKVWGQIASRSSTIASPTATLDFSSLPYGRADPFQP